MDFIADQIDAGALREPLAILNLAETETGWDWDISAHTRGKVEVDGKTNLFSAVGIGARNVTVTMRWKPWLALHHAIRWRGHHLFLTTITPVGHLHAKVTAALVDVVRCTAAYETDDPGPTFPAVLREKYVKHSELEAQDYVETNYVLITPTEITLRNGSLVKVEREGKEEIYHVLLSHDLDQWKHEYEMVRKEES